MGTNAAPPRVLVIEDDDAVREAIVAALRGEGFEIEAADSGLQLQALTRAFLPDLAILDVRLPQGPSGLGIARDLRSLTDMPIIFLTAADTVDDRLAGFDAGGDDYLTKPFAMAELLARVRVHLRRSGRLTSSAWQVSDIVVDEERRTVARAGNDVDLTRTEFDLLVALGRHPGRVLSKTQLLTDVWGFSDYDPNLVEVHMSSLRRKLESNGPRLIHTVRGVGYALRP